MFRRLRRRLIEWLLKDELSWMKNEVINHYVIAENHVNWHFEKNPYDGFKWDDKTFHAYHRGCLESAQEMLRKIYGLPILSINDIKESVNHRVS